MKVSRNALYGSLMLLPATVLLWVFTYQPILATIVNSLREMKKIPNGKDK